MPSIQPNVLFPLSGSSTAALGDRLRLRLLHLGGTLIESRWGGHDYIAPHWRVYLNLDDGAWAEVQGAKTPLRAGRLYVIPAWLHWVGGCRGRVRHLNALFDLPTAGRDIVSTTATGIFDLGGATSPLAVRWMELGVSLAHRVMPTASQVAQGYELAYAAMAVVCAQLGPVGERLLSPMGRAGLYPVLAIVEQHLSESQSVASLSRLAACSPAELHRQFLAGVGVSPMRWVRTRRVALAADLLRTTDLSIEAIATRTGFADRVRFSKVFAQHMGLGPAAWRKRELS